MPLSIDYIPDLRNRLTAKGLSMEEIDKLLIDTTELNVNYQPYLELQGKNVVPILFTDPDNKVVELLENINGVLLPGGDNLFELIKFQRDGLDFFMVDINESGLYIPKIKTIIDKTKEINMRGRYFPLFGICVGYEAILIIESNYQYPIGFVRQSNTTSQVEFTANDTKFKKRFNSDEINTLKDKSLMFFFHDLGFLTKDFVNIPNLVDNYSIAVENIAGIYGQEVAAIEHKTLPIFGIQFHPEKTIFENSPFYHINKSDEAIALSARFGSVINKQERSFTRKPKKGIRNSFNGEYYKVTVYNIGMLDKLDLVSRNRNILLLGQQLIEN